MDLTSRCEGLKEEGEADRESVRRMRDEVRRLKAEVALQQEVVRLLKVVATEWDESRYHVVEASLHVDSLSRHLEAERSEDRALRARMGGNC